VPLSATLVTLSVAVSVGVPEIKVVPFHTDGPLRNVPPLNDTVRPVVVVYPLPPEIKDVAGSEPSASPLVRYTSIAFTPDHLIGLGVSCFCPSTASMLAVENDAAFATEIVLSACGG